MHDSSFKRFMPKKATKNILPKKIITMYKKCTMFQKCTSCDKTKKPWKIQGK